MKSKTKKTVWITTGIALGFFIFTFTLVPLYNSLCRATGFHGIINLVAAPVQTSQTPEISRPLTMQFIATNNSDLAWDFHPKKDSIQIYPEQNSQMIFFIRNNTRKIMSVQAIPSVSPWQAAKHLHKIQCFCFTKQTLKPGESMDMPVVFRIDKDLPHDIKTITLAYTIFNVS